MTTVLTNATVTRQIQVPSTLHVCSRNFEVLPFEGKLKYLGRKVSFNDPNGCEFSNRITAAWGAFSKHETELTDKRYRLKDRLWLFSAVVTPTVLYGCVDVGTTDRPTETTADRPEENAQTRFER